jgi:hypothetical protein
MHVAQQSSCRWCVQLAQLKFYVDCKFKISIKPKSKIQTTHIKSSTISKIPNTSQMLIFPSLSMHYSTMLVANDLQIQVLLGLFNDAVGYRYKGLLPTDEVM